MSSSSSGSGSGSSSGLLLALLRSDLHASAHRERLDHLELGRPATARSRDRPASVLHPPPTNAFLTVAVENGR
jgi:hypothetical protein